MRRKPVGVDAGADDDPRGLDLAGRRLDHGRPCSPREAHHVASEQKLPARPTHVVRIRLRHPREVDDRGLGRVQRCDSRGVRLELGEPLRADQLDARDAVRKRAAVELEEPRALLLTRRDDDLAAPEHRDPACVAIREQPLGAAHAEPRLERARRVVDAAVDDPARAAGLVRADDRLLVEDGDRGARYARLQLARDSEPEDPGADDDSVVPRRAHRQVTVYSGPEPPSGGVRRPPLALIAPHWTQFEGVTFTSTVPSPSASPTS